MKTGRIPDAEWSDRLTDAFVMAGRGDLGLYIWKQWFLECP
jgi:hypothetical protein